MGILDRNKSPESGLSKTSSSSTQMQSSSVASGPKQQQHLKANGNKKGTYLFLNNTNNVEVSALFEVCIFLYYS